MIMQTTKAHRNGPHRSRKSRRASVLGAAQGEIFNFSGDAHSVVPGASDHRTSRNVRGQRHGGGWGTVDRRHVSFGSFASAKAHRGQPTQALNGLMRPVDREAAPDARVKLGPCRLGDSHAATARVREPAPRSAQARAARGLGAPEPGGEELRPLIPRVVSADLAVAGSQTVSRFAVPRGYLRQTRSSSGARARSGTHSPLTLSHSLGSAAADVRSGPRAVRGERRARLTARGHIAVMVLIATAIAGTSAIVNADQPGAAPVAATQEVLVHPGDTVEAIASRFAVPSNRAELVALIRAANGLSGASDSPLPAGDYLIVPAS